MKELSLVFSFFILALAVFGAAVAYIVDRQGKVFNKTLAAFGYEQPTQIVERGTSDRKLEIGGPVDGPQHRMTRSEAEEYYAKQEAEYLEQMRREHASN